MAVARSCGFLRAPVLAEIAEAMARTGQHAQAEAIARSVTDPFHGGAALAKVAEALAEVGEVHSAARVAAALCASSTETWRTAVVPVLLLAPTAITTLARILEEQ
jgi:hypothetical protein